MDSLNSTIQLAIGLLTCISLFLAIIEKYKKFAKENSKPENVIQKQEILHFFKTGDRNRNVHDLSLTLILSAILTTIIAYSILPADTSISNDKSSLTLVGFVILLIPIWGLASWYYSVMKNGLLLLTFSSFFVLSFSPRGPFNVWGVPNAEESLQLFLPLMVLVIIISMLFNYKYRGSLISFFSSLSIKPAIVFFLVPIFIAILAQSTSFYQSFDHDERIPKRLSDSFDTTLVSLLEDQNVYEQAYQIFSEINLSSYYSEQYLSGLRTYLNAEAYVNTPTNEDFRPRSRGRTDVYTRQFRVLFDILSSFEDLNLSEKQNYLASRLDWVHPTSKDNDPQSIVLTGSTPKDRLINLSNSRVFTAFSNFSDELRTYLLYSFPYSKDIINQFVDKDKNPAEVFRDFFTPAEKPVFFNVYPDKDFENYDISFRNELALPLILELFIAYENYKQAVIEIASSENSNVGLFVDRFFELENNSQEAFKYYTTDLKPEEITELVQALQNLNGIDFEPVDNSKEFYPYRKLASMIEKIRDNNSEKLSKQDSVFLIAKKYAKQVNRRFDPLLFKHMKITGKDLDIRYLFSSDLLAFLADLYEDLSTKDQFEFFKIIADPITYFYLHQSHGNASGRTLRVPLESIEAYLTLEPEDQANFLHHLAINVYRFEGPFGLNTFEGIVYKAKSINSFLGLVSSIALFAPLFFLSAYLGIVLSKRLLTREQLLESIHQEYRDSDFKPYSEELVKLAGRESSLERISLLCKKNRSTIAITGRRGSGKSRLLREIYSRDDKNNIGIWIDCPTRYSQEDFVTSILERLALAVENRISVFAGGKSLTTRRLEKASFSELVRVILILGLMSVLLPILIFEGQALLIWGPVLLLLTLSGSLMIVSYLKLQPLDIANQFGSDRKEQYQTSMLLMTTRNVLKFLRNRNGIDTEIPTRVSTKVVRLVFLILIGVTALFFLTQVIFYTSPSGFFSNLMAGLLPSLAEQLFTLIVLVIAWTLVWRIGKDPYTNVSGKTLISLIDAYRQYAKEIVYRLRHGALGANFKGIVVCIDELDKITNDTELREFIRNIKSIFDIDGVRYFLSISEDALMSFTLGSIAGKNEFDSSFDHIVYIESVDIATANEIVKEYMTTQLETDIDDDHSIILGFLSFGVPRDIIRKCERYIVNSLLPNSNHDLFYLDRIEKLDSAYTNGLLNGEELDGLKADAGLVVSKVKKYFQRDELEDRKSRLLAYIAILALAEKEISTFAQPKNTEQLEKLYSVGFGIPILPINDLKRTISELILKYQPA